MSNDWTKLAIVVRKRTVEETRDLTFLVIGKEFRRIAFYYGALVLPIFLIDLALFALYSWTISAIAEIPTTFENAYLAIPYLAAVLATISLESTFAGSLTTQFLGIWLFRRGEKIDPRDVFAAWFSRIPQLFYFLVLMRFFCFRFFYAETILLEKTPFFGKRATRNSREKTSTGRRVVAINSGVGGELFGESTSTAFFLLGASTFGYFILAFLVSTIAPESRIWFPLMNFVFFPLFVFLLYLFVVVYNFFRYINFRVEREGWDLDLAFKVERTKLATDSEFGSSENGGGRTAPDALRTLTFDREFFDDKQKEMKTANALSNDATLKSDLPNFNPETMRREQATSNSATLKSESLFGCELRKESAASNLNERSASNNWKDERFNDESENRK